jgi:hypothetical protein
LKPTLEAPPTRNVTIELISPSIQYGRFERRPAPQQAFNPQNKIKIFGYERLKNLNF